MEDYGAVKAGGHSAERRSGTIIRGSPDRKASPWNRSRTIKETEWAEISNKTKTSYGGKL